MLLVFRKILVVQFLFLSLMSVYRFIFFIYYNNIENVSSYLVDIIKAFVLGARIDLTVLSYIQMPITLFFMIIYYMKSKKIIDIYIIFVKYYLIFFYLVIVFLYISDFGFYSYFKDHINILYFGLFEDDTYALLVTMWQNYNIPLMVILISLFIFILYLFIKKQFIKIGKFDYDNTPFMKSFSIFLIILVINFIALRGSFGMYPLGSMIPNISSDKFINILPQNGVRAFVKAYKIKKKYNTNYDLISMVGFKNTIEEAFKILSNKDIIDNNNLLKNITYTTKNKIDNIDYNVVVIMVESFGMPILKYNSESFNIMGALKKHFDEDVLFTNFISTADGTIGSLESMLLNIPYRPSSFPFSQSKYAQTSFKYSPSYVFKSNGYENSFLYGGDLSWRDIGKFVKYQGYDNVLGKIDIYNDVKNSLKLNNKDDYFHPWGIFDQYLYDTIFDRLINSNKKQYIFALSTNNHPPYTLPKGYISKSLEISPKLDKHIISNRTLIQKRFASYGYALDSLGKFLTKVKNSKLKNNTIVVITADNNTIEGNMRYDKTNRLLTTKNIPFYIYIPKQLKRTLNIDTTVFGSHKDIYPTIYNLVLDKAKYISVGTNMLDNNITHIGVNGSLICVSKNNQVKVTNLNKKSDIFEINYYRALLGVSGYLINSSK